MSSLQEAFFGNLLVEGLAAGIAIFTTTIVRMILSLINEDRENRHEFSQHSKTKIGLRFYRVNYSGEAIG